MTPEEVSALAAKGESELLEFKQTTKTRREAARTICAMLNQRGGQVLFGITPKGKVAGQQTADRTFEELSAEIREIDPQAFPCVERVPVADDRAVIVVTVLPGSSKPYQYRGKAYRRIGNTTAAMQSQEYDRVVLERHHGEQRWENQPALGWSINDLHQSEVRLTVEEAIRLGRLEVPATRATPELLLGLGLIKDGALLRAAIALFGKNERIMQEMPQCLLRVARFRGTDKTEFLDNRQFYGNAFTLFSAAQRFLRETLPIAGRIEKDRPERIDEPLYPPLATREAIANAICYRDYAIGGGSIGIAVFDDRLEITSTGNLPFGLTPTALFGPHESQPWNPLIARAFYLRGIIEEWGRGTLKMAEEAAEAGLPPLEIDDVGGCVTIRFRANRMAVVPAVVPPSTAPVGEPAPLLNERQRRILDLLETSGEPLALREIRVRLELQPDARRLRRDLANLKRLGIVESNGHGRGARWKPL
ncbi:MAG: putative DNA binding domain-containing protein [Gammaproteobacteria bacterium]|nr:putative DNA binding domain-containing protein [Gammaproteobacteria bacterium]MDE0270116.1 putative DNA binding domain-containing protein [Gammaproteobacteria bacterium]